MRIQIDDSSGHFLLGFAKNKLKQIEKIRLSAGLSVLNKNLIFNEFQVFVESASWGDKIRISGGGFVYDIILSDQALLYGFVLGQYKTESLKIPANPQKFFSQMAHDVVLHPDEIVRLVKKKTTKTNTTTDLTFGALVSSLEKGAVATPDGVYTLHGGDLVRVATYTGLEPIVPPVGIGNLFGVFGKSSEGIDWNRNETAHLWAVSLSGGNSFPAVWKWCPRLWCPTLANPHILQQGIYYGSVFGGGLWGPCGEIEAHYGTFLDSRGGKDIGYCEALIRCEECQDDKLDGDYLKLFFFYNLWEPPRAFDYYLNINGRLNSYHDYYQSAPAQEFRIDYEELLPGAKEFKLVSWWSSPDYINERGDDIPLEGILAVGVNNTFALHKRTNYTRFVLTGENYKDHSVAPDGKRVAILYGEGKADRLLIYHLAGEKRNEEGEKVTEEVEEEIYNGTLLGGKADFFAVEIMPRFETKPIDVESPAPQSSNLTLPVNRQKKYEGPLLGFSHPWPPGRGFSASGWKIFIEEKDQKLVGIGKQFEDDCWLKLKYLMYADKEVNQFESHNLIMAGGPNGIHGTSGQITEEGIPTVGGWSPAGGGTVVQRSGISFGENIYGCLTYSQNVKPPAEWSGDVDEGVIFGGSPCVRPAYPCKTEIRNGISVQVAKITLTDQCVKATQELVRPAVWNTVHTECAPVSSIMPGNGWCFGGGPNESCSWVYTSPSSRYTITGWSPLGSPCDAVRIEQELDC